MRIILFAFSIVGRREIRSRYHLGKNRWRYKRWKDLSRAYERDLLCVCEWKYRNPRKYKLTIFALQKYLKFTCFSHIARTRGLEEKRHVTWICTWILLMPNTPPDHSDMRCLPPLRAMQHTLIYKQHLTFASPPPTDYRVPVKIVLAMTEGLRCFYFYFTQII